MKTTTFEQLKTMLKSMSYSIFNRIGSLEAIIKPPHKPQNMAYVTDENGNAGWAELPKQATGGDKNWVVKSTAYDALIKGEEIPDIAEYYSDKSASEIVKMVQESTLNGITLYYYDKDDSQAKIIMMDRINIMQYGETDSGKINCMISAETTVPSTEKSFMLTYFALYDEYDLVTRVTG